MNKTLKYSLLFLFTILFAFTVLLYQFPYDKLINRFTSQYDFHIESEKISYRPISSLNLKNISIISAKDKNTLYLLESSELLLDFYIFPLFQNILSTDLYAKAYNGEITGQIEYNLKKDSLNILSLEFKNLDISQYSYPNNFQTLFKIKGLLSGKIILNKINNEYKGNGDLLLSGPVIISEIVYNGINFPNLEFKEISFNFEYNNNTFLLKKLEFNGRTILALINGQIELHEPIEQSLLALSLWIGPSKNTKQNISNILTLFTGTNLEKGLNIKIHGTINNPEFKTKDMNY
ncbi:MAG: type II secretion system protein GspN [Candidatus Firestonebacteria bacterium]|nr:type II secretion system protein GspN [Candidatus Firestonebacteria bacterium]